MGWVVVALAGGILGGERLGAGSGTVLLVAGLVVGASGGWARRRNGRGSTRVGGALGLVVVALVGAASMQRALDGLLDSPLSGAVASMADVTADVVLTDDPDGPRFTTQVLVRVERFRVGGSWHDGGDRTVLVEAGGDVGTRLGLLIAGDGARLSGFLGPLDGFDERQRWQHAVATFRATELRRFRAATSVLARSANAVRALVLEGLAVVPGTERSVLEGFLLGDTRSLPSDVEQRFRTSGLSHLLAVSGGNVAFVLALVGPALRRMPRSVRLVATLAVLVVFGAMTRWEPSVLRAVVMAGCATLALHLGRPATARRALALTVAALLLADPFLVHSIGFLLSCGASLGIVLLAGPLADRLVGPSWLRTALATTIAAQLGVAPLLAPVFGGVPLVSIPANVVMGPLVGPLTMGGLIVGVVGGVLGPSLAPVGAVLALPVRGLVQAALGVADAASRVPAALDGPGLLLVVALGVAWWLWRGRT